MNQTFYSNGKLLITGEYTVLDGAQALALPTRYGQYMEVTPGTGKTILWKSLDADGSVWLESELLFEDIISGKGNTNPQIDMLTAILHDAYLQNPEVLENSGGCIVTTKLTFPRQWGLGTSSTLINNIAQWFGADAYRLLNKSFGGSGYDIACAQYNTPLLYSLANGKALIKPVQFNPDFADNLWFVYLNQKQNSREAITAYKERKNDIASTISQINALTERIVNAATVTDFAIALQEHENIMATVLDMSPVKKSLFADFVGAVKSLGAWGGDFVLAVSGENPEAYFRSKGYDTIIPYNRMILK